MFTLLYKQAHTCILCTLSSFLETFLAKKPSPPPDDLVIRHSEDVLSLIPTQESTSDVIEMYFSLIPTQESTSKV